MKFGLQHPNFTFDGDGPELIESLKKLATQAEALGFDSFWVMDHLHQIQNVGQPQEPMLDSWTTLAVLSGYTSRIRLGPLVTGNTYRHPSVLAKMGATLDVLSNGRLFMGIGAAWNQEEAVAYGIPWPSTLERLRRLEEAVQVIRKMWTEERATFDGKYYKIREAFCNPKPIQKRHPPILIGGSGEKETLRIVAKYGDACNLFGSPATVTRKLAILREHCARVVRDFESILKTKLGSVMIDKSKEAADKRLAERFKGVPEQMRGEFVMYGTPDDVRRQVEAFRQAGIDYLIVNLEAQRELEALKLFADEIVKTF
jgi:F420-dependent oxidoreductase-like protein